MQTWTFCSTSFLQRWDKSLINFYHCFLLHSFYISGISLKMFTRWKKPNCYHLCSSFSLMLTRHWSREAITTKVVSLIISWFPIRSNSDIHTWIQVLSQWGGGLQTVVEKGGGLVSLCFIPQSFCIGHFGHWLFCTLAFCTWSFRSIWLFCSLVFRPQAISSLFFLLSPIFWTKKSTFSLKLVQVHKTQHDSLNHETSDSTW
jgi:hypothetical protein